MKNAIFLMVILLILTSYNLTAQWVQDSAGMGGQNVSSLAANSNTIFAGTNNNGVYLSANYGLNWIQTPLNNRTVSSLASNGDYVFAGTYPNTGLYISSNNGTSWTQSGFSSNGIPALAVNGNNLFAAYFYYPPHPCAFGVSRSLNNGSTWNSSLFCVMVNSLAVSGNTVLAGTGGVLLSTDNGGSWSPAGIRNRSVNSLAINGNIFFAGTLSYGVYLTTINDTNWIQTLNDQTVNTIVVNGNDVFAGTTASGVFVSINNGTTWTQRNEGLGNFYVRSLCILNNYIFAGTFGNGVYRRPLSELTEIRPVSNEIPQQYQLYQNYPNPFNPTTKIRFDVPVGTRRTFLQLKIHDILGREITTLVNEQLSPGTYEATWEATNYPSGVYYYKLISADYSDTKKMILMK